MDKFEYIFGIVFIVIYSIMAVLALIGICTGHYYHIVTLAIYIILAVMQLNELKFLKRAKND